jgi:ketosteroid isomerase-like protein
MTTPLSFEGPLGDRLAIRELVDSYGDAVSRSDATAWGANWCDDSVWTLNLPGLEKVEGRQNIIALWVRAMAEYDYVYMVASPGAIRVSGERATGRFYTSELTRLKTGEEQRIVGRYEDDYEKSGDRWLFKSRDYKMLHLQRIKDANSPA